MTVIEGRQITQMLCFSSSMKSHYTSGKNNINTSKATTDHTRTQTALPLLEIFNCTHTQYSEYSRALTRLGYLTLLANRIRLVSVRKFRNCSNRVLSRHNLCTEMSRNSFQSSNFIIFTI